MKVKHCPVKGRPPWTQPHADSERVALKGFVEPAAWGSGLEAEALLPGVSATMHSEWAVT